MIEIQGDAFLNIPFQVKPVAPLDPVLPFAKERLEFKVFLRNSFLCFDVDDKTMMGLVGSLYLF